MILDTLKSKGMKDGTLLDVSTGKFCVVGAASRPFRVPSSMATIYQDWGSH